jgi:hypothetical protein
VLKLLLDLLARKNESAVDIYGTICWFPKNDLEGLIVNSDTKLGWERKKIGSGVGGLAAVVGVMWIGCRIQVGGLSRPNSSRT